MLIGQQPGRKYRWDNQTGSRGRAMRTGEFWEEESSFLCSCKPDTEEANVTMPLKKVLSHVAIIDKNNGLI